MANGKRLDEGTIRSDMLSKLLIYLLLHREHPLTVQELADALWEEDETDNPAGALKNLMYRLRNLLKQLEECEYIVTGRGTYCWNPKVDVSLDAELFEDYCEKAKRSTVTDEQIRNYESAISLYRGEFMPKIGDKHWILALSAYYHSLLVSAVTSLTELYMQEKRYEKAEHICAIGLKYDGVNEWFHCYRIKALMAQNKQKLALDCYDQATRVLYEMLGICNSEPLREVYEELLTMGKGNKVEDMECVQEDMREKELPDGAYVCGYPVFRAVYQLEARKIGRLGESQYIMLVTLEVTEEVFSAGEKMARFVNKQAMEHMEEVLKKALRIGDIISRYSDSQYVILLPTCTYESCHIVSERIMKRFYEKNRSDKIRLKIDFQEVLSASAWIK